MANPAEQLLAQFREWSAGGPPQTVRNMAKPDVSTPAHAQAMKNIGEIGTAIDELEGAGRNVDGYRKRLTDWVHAIIAYPAGWTDNNANRKLFTAHMMEMLERLSEEMKHAKPPLPEPRRNELQAFVTDIGELNTTDPTLPDELRTYIHRLVQHVNNCIDDYETLGWFDLCEAFERLRVAVMAAEGQSSGEWKAKWGERLVTFGVATGATAVGNVASTLLMITGG